MFGSCRFCFAPTDKWEDFCNDCAVRETPPRDVPRFRVIQGGKSRSERARAKKTANRWLTPVSAPPHRSRDV